MSDMQWTTFAPGARRSVIIDGDKLMLVQIELDKDAAVAQHSHPHEQATYVLSGKVEFTISGVVSLLVAGQAIHMPSNAPHSVVATEACTLLDTFSPPREDFRAR